jgi:peptidoglycan hydrolase CwlO-like protein
VSENEIKELQAKIDEILEKIKDKMDEFDGANTIS